MRQIRTELYIYISASHTEVDLIGWNKKNKKKLNIVTVERIKFRVD